MSALGRKQTHAPHNGMSALSAKAGIYSALAHVCFGPKAGLALNVVEKKERPPRSFQL